MKKRVLVLMALLFAIVATYMYLEAAHRQDLEQLGNATYDVNKRYCVYKITKATPSDDQSFNIDDKICIECRDGWPGTNQICYSRIKYTSVSGYYTYEAELFDGLVKECNACTTAKAYYRKP